MRRMLLIGICWAVASGPIAAQDAGPAASNISTAAGSTGQAALYRDPRTGELYQQELQTVDQPVTHWQRKLVERTVVTPQTVIENQQVPQTVYVAKTEYVLQTRLKGWWNPLAQPTYAYEYVPVTRWFPQTQMITQQVPATKMIARTEQVPIDEPVQTTQKVTHVIMRKLPQNMGTIVSAPSTVRPTSPAAWAVNTQAYRPALQAYPPVLQSWPAQTPPTAHPSMHSQPLIASVPILSQQRVLPWQPGTLLTAPVNGLRSIVRSGPFPSSGQANYAAPLNVASRPVTSWSRDPNQLGMPATVVR